MSLLNVYKERVWCVPEQNRNGVKSGIATNTLKRLLWTVSWKALPSALRYLIVLVVKKAAGLITKQILSSSEETALLLYNHLCLSWSARQIPCEKSVRLRASATSWLSALVLLGSQGAPLLQTVPPPGGCFTGWACTQTKRKLMARGDSVALDLYTCPVCWCI